MICKRLSNIVPKLPSLSRFSNCFCSSLIRWLTQDSVSKANRSNEDLLRSLLVKGGGTRFNEEGLRNALCMIIKLLSSFVYSAVLSAVIRFIFFIYRRLVRHNFPPVILCCYHRTRLDIYIPQRWDDRLAVNLESKPLFTVSANTLILYASIRQHVGSWEPQVKTVLVRGVKSIWVGRQ